MVLQLSPLFLTSALSSSAAAQLLAAILLLAMPPSATPLARWSASDGMADSATSANDTAPEQTHTTVGANDTAPEQTHATVGANDTAPAQTHATVGAEGTAPAQAATAATTRTGSGLGPEILSRFGSIIEVHGDLSQFTVLSREQIIGWIDIAVSGLHVFYGRMPVERVKVFIGTFEGSGVRNGTAFGTPSPHIRIRVGNETPIEMLERDWKMAHEFVHMAVPRMRREQMWLDEGLATYVEPLARYKVGNVTEAQIWKWLIEGVPNALTPGLDTGLDNTRRWGTTYWGGALFCLLADIELREATGNKLGLREALRVLVEHGHVIEKQGDAAEMLAEADAALGVDVLSGLYQRLSRSPFRVDLAELWRQLGVRLDDDGEVVFDDQARLAHIRRAISRK